MEEQHSHPENRNLVSKLYKNETSRKKLAELVLHEFEADFNSSVGFFEMQAEWIDSYFNRESTERPFDGASQESVPLLFEACSHFHARAMKNLFRSESIVKVIPTEHIDEVSKDRAHRLTQHMRYTVFRRIKNYKKHKDALLQALPLRGSMFTKVYQDPLYGFMRVKNLRPHELIIPYGTGPQEMEDIPRKTERHFIPYNTAKNLFNSGFFSVLPEPYRGSTYGYGLSEVDEAIKDIFEADEPVDTEDYCLVLEQRRFLDVFEAGWPVPVSVWVDPIGGDVVRLTINYETDEAGRPVDPYASALEPYTHYQYLPNPDGTYGIGHGLALGQINTAVNRMLRTTIDSSILSTVSGLSGFIDSKAMAGRGSMRLKLGEFTPVDNLESLAKGVWTPQFPGPNPTLVSIMEWLSGKGDRAAMVTDLVTGQADKVMQPTAVSQLLAQTDTLFTAAQDRVMETWTLELRNIFDFNRKFLPPEEYFTVMDVDTGDREQIAIHAQDYNKDFQVQAIIEPAKSAQERIALAEGVLGATQYFPELSFMPLRKRQIAKKYLEALGVTPLEEVLPGVEEWLAASEAMMKSQVMELEAQAEEREDKQEHDSKENRLDRISEEKIARIAAQAREMEKNVQNKQSK